MKERESLGSRLGFILLSAACAALIFAGCGSPSSSAGTVTENADGTYTAKESSSCAVAEQGLSYDVKLAVTADADGTILSVEDDGTEVPDGKDGAWKEAQALFDEFIGKNGETVSDVDAVSGATASSEAILKAVRQGLKDIENGS